MSTKVRFRDRDRLVLPVVLLVAAVFLLRFVESGWIPGDVGLLGQTAERVLTGELPHLDFRDMYTGGQAFLFAGAFALFGIDASVLRWLLYATTLLALPIPYLLARRTVSALPAAGLTLLGLVWSVPLYFEAMPSWFNLFLALAATQLLVGSGGDSRRRFLAGLCIGASVAIKSVGLLVTAAAFLYFIYLEQETRCDDSPSRLRTGSWFVTLGLLGFLLSLVAFVSQWPTFMNLVHFVVPGATLVGLLLWREWHGPSGSAWMRLRRLLGLAAPLLAGLSLPLMVLCVPYARHGALGALLDPSVLFPAERVDRAYYSLPSSATLVCLLPIAFVFLLSFVPSRVARLDRRLALPALLVAVLLLSFGSKPSIYQLVWFAVRPLVPLVTLVGCIQLARGRITADRAPGVVLVLSVTALASLVQFPQSMGLYFGYVAPLVVLAYAYVATAVEPIPKRLHGVFGLLLAGYGLLWITPSHPLNHGIVGRPLGQMVPLGLPRADTLRVSPGDRQIYQSLVDLIHRHAPAGSCIWAGPDAPQIYFLSDRCNPTPTLCEIFDPDYGTAEAPHRILELIAEGDIPIAVLNRAPPFSRPSAELAQGLARSFGQSLALREFVVFWNPTGAPVKPLPPNGPTVFPPPEPGSPAGTSRTATGGVEASGSPVD